MDTARVTASVPWKPGRLVLYFSIVSIAYLVTAAVAMGVVGAVLFSLAVPASSLDAWIIENAANGTMLAAGAIATAVVCLPLMRYLVGRIERSPWDFLGFRRVPAKTIMTWVAVELALIVVFDSTALAMNEPVITEDMLFALETSNLLFLLAGVVIAAPLLEEVFCRGFLFGALLSLRIQPAVIVLLTSVFFTVLHVQYSGIALFSVLVGAVIWAVARLRTGSVLPCIAMHFTGNLVATVELIIYAH